LYTINYREIPGKHFALRMNPDCALMEMAEMRGQANRREIPHAQVNAQPLRIDPTCALRW